MISDTIIKSFMIEWFFILVYRFRVFILMYWSRVFILVNGSWVFNRFRLFLYSF
jgi:hypothetical protein